jgi:hypothetical protein
LLRQKQRRIFWELNCKGWGEQVAKLEFPGDAMSLFKWDEKGAASLMKMQQMKTQ